MKSKNPAGFWLRWMGIATLHTFFFSWLWSFKFIEWPYAFWLEQLYYLASMIFLSALQFWAITPRLRPSAKRWLSISILSYVFHRLLLKIFDYGNIAIPYSIGLLIEFLPLAILQSWVLSERFYKAWIYGIAIGLAALYQLSLIGHVIPPIPSQQYFHMAVFDLGKAVFMGMGMFILQKYHIKEINLRSEKTT